MLLSNKKMKLFFYLSLAVILLSLIIYINYREGFTQFYNNNRNNVIKNVALLIPIHPPHYHYIYNLINNCKKDNIEIDMYYVFSNEEDYNTFTMKQDISPIICNAFETQSIITYKKLVGLKHLANSNYDYIICCDSEIDIISKNFNNSNINNKIRDIFNNKIIYAGYSNDPFTIYTNRSCAKLFEEKFNYIEEITEDFTLYV